MEQTGRRKFVIRRIPGRLAVVRLEPGSRVPSWAWTGPVCAVVRTPDEVTIVCDETLVPGHVTSERDWVALMIEGPLPFSTPGVLASLLDPLASHHVPVFILSTFTTDWILVKAGRAQEAGEILRSKGHVIR